MRVLVFGASGMLGQDLTRGFSGDHVSAPSSLDVNLCHEHQVLSAVQRIHPDWVVLSAAYADVDGCEKDPTKALAVNRDGAIHVARAAQKTGSRLLFLSSDYVFDGEKQSPYEIDDPRNPINVYGRSKAEAESRLLEILPECCIVRTSWLFGVGGKCFPDTILKLAQKQSELRVVDDQRGCPTYTLDLASAIAALTRQQASGIVHATNSGSCTWYEFARAVLAARNTVAKVVPVTTSEFPRPARRPAYSLLSNRSLLALGTALPDWQDALVRYLQQRND